MDILVEIFDKDRKASDQNVIVV